MIDDYVYTQEQIMNCLYDRAYTCPCCDTVFNERAVRKSAVTLSATDRDLRNIYTPVDTILYDIVCCTGCGYASLKSTFENLPFKQAQLIAGYISPRFKNKTFPQIYTYDIGVIRYKAAILTALITRKRSSEIGYLYMKLAWVFRSLNDSKSEEEMLRASVAAFIEAEKKEFYPFFDMNEETALYVIGDFLYRLSKIEQAKSFFNKLSDKNDLSQNIKERMEKHPLAMS